MFCVFRYYQDYFRVSLTDPSRTCTKQFHDCFWDLHGSINCQLIQKKADSKAQNKAEWLVPPSHHWYKGRKPGPSLSLPCDRQSSTCLSRLASCHMNCLTYSEGNKTYPLCPKCQQHQASP
ncbi:hypothetical protein AVEN_1202-1 [Araneus ventricosus]|uniref:Uncharacterized protein n=1 Tax=Araneus ventricosus TaxID=182803 RepID=A0A4Y2NFB9_ARAVE|nr:hypothetical protein AVEN_1202-1 [Araneus ventricosus]